MKVVYIVPGSGGNFYCANCLRDGMLISALRSRGVDVTVVPLYLPLFLDGEGLDEGPVFFGAVNIYLQQKNVLFRKTPRWMDRVLDSRRVLEWAARKAGTTRPTGLSEMTASMLRGEKGRQAKELRRLVAWLGKEVRPDVVHLSNALLLGMAPAIREAVDAKLVCSLQDEDAWVDPMVEEEGRLVWDLMAQAAVHVDAFAASSRYFADLMIGRLGLDPDSVRVVYPGVDPSAYSVRDGTPPGPVLGYLSRLSAFQGLDRLARAFAFLAGKYPDLRLRAFGGYTAEDAPFVARVTDDLDRQGLAGRFDLVEGLGRDIRVDFLKSLSVLSVPVPGGEAFGMYLLEALACGVPVVQPRAGAYPEIVEATGGGLLYPPDDPRGLERALDDLLSDGDRAATLSAAGRRGVEEKFTIDRAASALIDIYATIVQRT